MISISLNPNIQQDDLNITKKALYNLILNKKNKSLDKLQKEIENYFPNSNIYLTNSGRSSLDLLFRALSWNKKTEIAIQSFTCSAAISPIIWNKLKPIYIDIDNSWNMDPKDLEKKISKNTKAVIIQHSFGYPADIDKILSICKKYNLLLIEDCAVSLGAEYKNKPIGAFGDISYLSFGRDKTISGFGGALIVKKQNNTKLIKDINNIYNNYKNPAKLWAIKSIIYPLIIQTILPIYKHKIGKVILKLLQSLNIMSLPYEKVEYSGKRPDTIGFKLPEELADILLNQWRKLPIFIQHRKNIAKEYELNMDININRNKVILQKINKESNPSPLRFNMLLKSKNTTSFIKQLRKHDLYLGNWYSSILDPKQTNLKIYKYEKGSCPNAEKIADKVINLPTHINIKLEDVKNIIKILLEEFN